MESGMQTIWGHDKPTSKWTRSTCALWLNQNRAFYVKKAAQSQTFPIHLSHRPTELSKMDIAFLHPLDAHEQYINWWSSAGKKLYPIVAINCVLKQSYSMPLLYSTLCRHPKTTGRPSFASLVFYLSKPDTELLAWSDDDRKCHPQASLLGAFMAASTHLYPLLQTTYMDEQL